MKNFLSKMLILAVMSTVMAAILPNTALAQYGFQVQMKSAGNGLTLDSVTNAGVKQFTVKAVGYYATIGIQVDITKISGTLGGTLIPIASNDGVTYYPCGAGTLTVTDVAAQGILFTPLIGFQYYGVRWTGTGTMVGSFKANLVARKTTL